MKKIGVLARPEKHDGRLYWCINGEIKQVIMEYGYLPYLIYPIHLNDELNEEDCNILKEQLKECSGVILQGGSEIYGYDRYVCSYLYEHDIPTLGICLGMQTMAGGKLDRMDDEKIKNHYDQKDAKYAHENWIQPGTKLFEIVEDVKIPVNSRHHDYVLDTDFFVSSYSKDGIIEAIEDAHKKFYIGVQWHPESMIAYDKVSKKLFDAFFQVIGGQNETKTNSAYCEGEDTFGK